MIEYLRGTCVMRTPTAAVMEVQSIGYEVFISLNTFNELAEGQEARLWIHEVIREDSHDLFGFYEVVERTLFRLLITVNGVGPNTARVMLSTFAPLELARKIADGDEDSLKAIKGIGTKTAQRIIVDLKKKISAEMVGEMAGDARDGAATPAGVDKEVCEEAVRAFVALGYPAAAARKVVASIAKAHPGISINDMVRMGLRMF